MAANDRGDRHVNVRHRASRACLAADSRRTNAAGVMPSMRPASPKVRGRTAAGLSRISLDKPTMSAYRTLSGILSFSCSRISWTSCSCRAKLFAFRASVATDFHISCGISRSCGHMLARASRLPPGTDSSSSAVRGLPSAAVATPERAIFPPGQWQAMKFNILQLGAM